MRGLEASQRPTLPDMLSQGQTLSTPAEKATALNAFFISQSQQSVTGCNQALPSIHFTTPNTPGLTTLETTAPEGSKLLCLTCSPRARLSQPRLKKQPP